MPGIARIGDPFTDGDYVKDGSGNVFANNLPVARLGDSTTGHGGFPPVPIDRGSGNVFVNNLPVARVGDTHVVHCKPDSGCHIGSISSGSNNVLVN